MKKALKNFEEIKCSSVACVLSESPKIYICNPTISADGSYGFETWCLNFFEGHKLRVLSGKCLGEFVWTCEVKRRWR
jgi:hypothetical protein